MKKKFLVLFLTLVSAVYFIIGLTACGDNGGGEGLADGVYAVYVILDDGNNTPAAGVSFQVCYNNTSGKSSCDGKLYTTDSNGYVEIDTNALTAYSDTLCIHIPENKSSTIPTGYTYGNDADTVQLADASYDDAWEITQQITTIKFVTKTLYSVGDVFPDFTAKKFFADDGDETYSSADDLVNGKIVILNFWYIGCGGCEVEIPYFGALASNGAYADKVSVVIVHAGNSEFGAEDAYTYSGEQMQYLEYYVQYKRDWSFYNSATWIMDAEDSSSLYLQLGGKGGYPMTAIIGTDGTIEYITYAGMELNQLYSVVGNILAE